MRKSAEVPALHRLVDRMNVGVDHSPHVGGKGVEGGLLGPRALEMAVLVSLSAQQPLLSHCDVQKGRDDVELGDQ